MNDQNQNQSSTRGRKIRRAVKRALLILVGVAVVAGVVVTAMPKPVPVELATIATGELVVTVDEDGKTRVKDRYVVSAPLTGNLGRIELDPGDEVEQGEVLARLVPSQAPLLDARSRSETEARVAAARAATRQAAAQIERAKAALEFSKTEASRVRQLYQSNAVSQTELDRALLEERARTAELTSAEFGAKVANHELQMTMVALGRHEGTKAATETLTVPSPVRGRVLKVLQKSEGVVQAGAPLLEVGDPKALEIVVDVLTSDAVHIQPGSPVTVEGWGGDTLKAAVRTIEPSAFTRMSALGVEEQRVNTVVELSESYDKWAKLGDGYRVEARIEVFRAQDTVTIPQSALFRHDGNWATFVVNDGVAELRVLEIGRRSDTHARVMSGLTPGEVVVVHPNDDVVHGARVRPL